MRSSLTIRGVIFAMCTSWDSPGVPEKPQLSRIWAELEAEVRAKCFGVRLIMPSDHDIALDLYAHR